VQAPHRRCALRGLAIELEGGRAPALVQSHFPDEGERERRFRVRLQEIVEGAAGQVLVGLPQVEPGRGIRGGELRDPAQMRLRLGRARVALRRRAALLREE